MIQGLQGETHRYIAILEKQISGVKKQLDQRKLFNPLESQIILNPLSEMKKQAAQNIAEVNKKMGQIVGEHTRLKSYP